jgi:hypothetical protein
MIDRSNPRPLRAADAVGGNDLVDIVRSPIGIPGFVQEVFPSRLLADFAASNARFGHRNERDDILGDVFAYYRLSDAVGRIIVPTRYSPHTTPRVIAAIQTKDAQMRESAGLMRDLLIGFAVPVPAGRLAVGAIHRGVNYAVGAGGRIVASRASRSTVRPAPPRVNTDAAMTELSSARAAENVTEIRLRQSEYEAALGRVFPGQSDAITRIVDDIGQRAAQRAINDARFIQAIRSNNVTQAGTLFHSAAATEARAVPASALPQGWTLTAEEVIQAGAGGSRLDLLFRGPAGQRVEIDWKTTGRSALSTGSRREMRRHAGQITVNIGGTVTRQESRSWFDYVRTLLHARSIRLP